MVRKILTASLLSMSCLLVQGAEARTPHEAEVESSAAGVRQAGLIQPRSKRSVAAAASPHLIDIDQDGAVSQDEATAHYAWLFGLLDVDGDRTVREAEFVDALDVRRPDPARREAHRARLGRMFARLDVDGDLLLHREEFLSACRVHFASSDNDGDGQVSVWEFRTRRPL